MGNAVAKLADALLAGKLLARLRQSQWPHGFLINFNAQSLGQGIRRLTR